MGVLETAREHLARAYELKVPVGEFGRWQDIVGPMRDAIATFETDIQAIHYAQRTLPFTHREPCLPVRLLNTWVELLEEEFPHFGRDIGLIGDDPRSLLETLWWSEQFQICTSNIHLWHLRVLFFCLSYIDRPKSILEIGGGHGSLARLWCLNHIAPCERYTIIDIPESLFFAETFLRGPFGDEVGYHLGTDPGTKIVLVPVQMLDKYDFSSDLVVNVGSMQEMSDPWVVYYSKWLDRHDTKWFYSLNYAGDPIGEMRESRTFWAPIMSKEWTCRVLNSDPPLVKVMCTRRNFAEHLYQKAESAPIMWSRNVYLQELNTIRHSFLNEPDVLVDFVKQVIGREHIGNLPRVPKELFSVLAIAEGQGNEEAAELKGKLTEMIAGLIP